MNLDRSLIKSQAKQLIKGNVFKLFIIIFVVTLLTSGGTIYSSVTNGVNQASDALSEDYGEYGLNNADEYDFDDFVNGYENQDNMEEFNLDDFAKQFENELEEETKDKKNVLGLGVLSGLSSIASIAMLFLAPLAVTLAGVFYQLIKGKNLGWSEEFGYVFGKTFDKNYWNKFLLNLLTGIFTALWSLLFIIPGIVYYYKIYFVNFIMADKPELSWKEAINISKKMTDGHKGELFVLDLSFIWWDILTGITFGLAGIYVLPYQYTTRALYYENFKIRAFQLGAMSDADFLTEGEKTAIAFANAQQQGGYSVPTPIPQAAPYQPPVQENVYQSPVQENIYQQPPVQENIYQTPVQENPAESVSEPPETEE